MKELKLNAYATSTKGKRSKNMKICSRKSKVKKSKYEIQKKLNESMVL